MMLRCNGAPGLSLRSIARERSGTNRSFDAANPRKESGTLRCTGTLDGRRIVTDKGTIGFEARYWGWCADVKGGGRWFFTLFVDDDGRERELHYEGEYDGPGRLAFIRFTGMFPGGTLKGGGPVVPEQGNCVTEPMTRATFRLRRGRLSAA